MKARIYVPTHEQLKDPAWWEENAPGWATHYGLVGFSEHPIWYNREQYSYLSMGKANIFEFGTNHTFDRDKIKPVAVLPTSEQEPKEWDGEEWPIPVGATVQTWLGEKRTVVAHDRNRDVCILRFEDEPEDYIAYTRAKAMGNLIRPINASAEREREETIDSAREALTTTFGVTDLKDDVELVLSTLYNAGLLRKGAES